MLRLDVLEKPFSVVPPKGAPLDIRVERAALSGFFVQFGLSRVPLRCFRLDIGRTDCIPLMRAEPTAIPIHRESKRKTSKRIGHLNPNGRMPTSNGDCEGFLRKVVRGRKTTRWASKLGDVKNDATSKKLRPVWAHSAGSARTMQLRVFNRLGCEALKENKNL